MKRTQFSGWAINSNSTNLASQPPTTCQHAFPCSRSLPYTPHLLAQTLNNRDAFCIEVGDWDQAVLQLVKPFKLLEQLLDNTTSCQCQHCSLDACMTYCQEISQHRAILALLNTTKVFQLMIPSKIDSFINSPSIHVTMESIQDCHSMGPTQFLFYSHF
jgi:hypothetical protein